MSVVLCCLLIVGRCSLFVFVGCCLSCLFVGCSVSFDGSVIDVSVFSVWGLVLCVLSVVVCRLLFVVCSLRAGCC